MSDDGVICPLTLSEVVEIEAEACERVRRCALGPCTEKCCLAKTCPMRKLVAVCACMLWINDRIESNNVGEVWKWLRNDSSL